MSKKTWIVWAMFLLLPGAVGLSIHFALNDSLYDRIDQAAQRDAENSAAKEYLQMYEQWSQLPAEEKADNPWGHGEYGGTAIQKRLERGQSDRLTADLPTLERGNSHYPDELADVLYGPGWQQAVDDYSHERSIAEMILIGSIFLMAVGGLIFVGGGVRQLFILVTQRRTEDEQAVETGSERSEVTTTKPTVAPLTSDVSKSDASTANDLSDKTSREANTEEDSSEKDSIKTNSEGYFQTFKKSVQDTSSQKGDGRKSLPMTPPGSKPKLASKVQKDSYFGWAIDTDNSTELDTMMTNEPLTKELTELTEEVSAIRQYAAQQQDQIRKLQYGYDWMIIRRFSLRIIRCIDNIDDRIGHLINEENQFTCDCLEDIRDELVFALESGGIEQYKPDLNIPFKGLEKYAEAIRERVYTEEPSCVGCIAEVARPGYQYLVSDDDVKIVRCAQVKLYETN